MYSRISRNVIKIVGGKCRLRSKEWKDIRLLILCYKSCRLENQMPSSRYIKLSAAFSHSSLKGLKFISVFVFCLFFFPEDEKLRQYQWATNANQDPVLKPRLHVRFFACDGDAIFSVSRNEFNSNKFHSWPFTQISFGFITLCQSLSCDILCLDRPSLSSKWPWTKSNSLLLPRVRFDINALSLNIQISRSCSNRLCLNLPREFRYCNGSEFEFPSWINKPLFGSKAIVSRYPFMDIWDTKQRALSLNLISFSFLFLTKSWLNPIQAWNFFQALFSLLPK